MNMPGMNPAAGGPVGGGMIMMMNNGNSSHAANSSSSSSGNSSHSELKRRLDTYIYDYFLKNGHHEHARALYRDDSIKLNTHPQTKSSPSRRRDTEMNGIDENAMDADSKDDINKIPDDLPKPDVPDIAQSGFLYDWFGLFFDIWCASRNKKPDDSGNAAQYLQQTQLMQRMRETQHSSNVLGRQGMMPNRQFGPQNMRNGMTQDMQRAMAAKQMSPAQFQQFQHQQKQHMMQQMQREQSENEMNGHRPQSPASTENAGSPSKRPRLDGQQFTGGPMAPNGRGQGGPQQQQQQQQQAMNMLMANGMSGRNMSQSQFQSFQAQNPAMQKNLQVYAQNLVQQQGRSMMNQGVSMPNGMMNPGVMPHQGSPMLGPVDGQNFMPNMSMDSIYNPQHMAALRQQANMQGANAQGGNHALQDYQMQLMLLEQQNKKRLMMARQEQDSITRTDGGPPMPGQPGMQQPVMSPGSRAGASPNPNDQMKRGTPQLTANGMPSSPSAGDGMPQARGSPAGMNFAGGMTPDFNNQLYMKTMGDNMVAPGAPGMRPPTSMNPAMNMEGIPRQPQGGRMPSGNWQGNPQGQPMMQQPPQAQPQAMGTPQQRAGEMPPPSAPAVGNAPGQRNQPPSPQPGQAPPTPSQSNKANPKSKKDKNEPKKKPNKRNSTANAPTTSEADPPATPTPSTPITPNNQASFAKGPSAPAGGNAPTSNPTPTSNPSVPQQQAPAVDPTANGGAFGDFTNSNEAFNLDFSGLETTDVLENFDFDSFLHNTDDGNNGFSFDPAMNFSEGLETGGME